jgi:hypothetical protein
MFCCANCFGDRGLRKNIIPLRSAGTGACSYCGSENAQVVLPSHLGEYFDLLVRAYGPDPEGKLLVYWFRQDWGLFDHPQMDDPRAKDLLSEILDDGEIVRTKFSPYDVAKGDGLGEWEELRDELMYRNRYFPKVKVDLLKRLERLLTHLNLDPDEVPNSWFRARLLTQDAAFAAAEMGAPSKKIASHGRANPAGIPYLYLGSTAETAVAEIRPHTGEMACVASFRTADDVKLIDLRSPRTMVSPFLLADAEDIGRMRNDLPFLERLGDELTRPVVPQSAAIQYTPSQYLCEFIKNRGYDGVIYRSSVSDGINLALFDPAKATCEEVMQYRVARVSVGVARL